MHGGNLQGAYGFLGYEVVSEVCNRSNLHHVRVPDGLQATNEQNSGLQQTLLGDQTLKSVRNGLKMFSGARSTTARSRRGRKSYIWSNIRVISSKVCRRDHICKRSARLLPKVSLASVREDRASFIYSCVLLSCISMDAWWGSAAANAW